MKTQFIAITFACGLLFLTACGGDHSSSAGKDTVKNTYGAKDTSKVDTSKTTSPDHTASGGSDLAKDTTKKDSVKK